MLSSTEVNEEWAKRVRLVRMNVDLQMQQLRVLKQLSQLSHDSLLCVMVVYNEMLRLPDTLRHYRLLGIDRFAIIDNLSDDGTLGWLLKQPDCDVYQMPGEMRHAMGGASWRSSLIHTHYGPDRWVVCSDADEQLVYDGCEQQGLRQLVNALVRQGKTSLPCLMLDMYSPAGILTAMVPPNGRLLDACPCFDRTGYRREQVEATPYSPPHLNWSGGPAEHFMNAPKGWLGKVSLLYWTDSTWCLNPHIAYPFASNFSEPRGALLHFKWLSDFPLQVATGVSRNQYAGNSEKYHSYQQVLVERGDICFMSDMSAYYTSSQSLLKHGLVDPIPY